MNFLGRDCLALAALPHGIERMQLQTTLDQRYTAKAVDRKFAELTARGYIDAATGQLTTRGRAAHRRAA